MYQTVWVYVLVRLFFHVKNRKLTSIEVKCRMQTGLDHLSCMVSIHLFTYYIYNGVSPPPSKCTLGWGRGNKLLKILISSSHYINIILYCTLHCHRRKDVRYKKLWLGSIIKYSHTVYNLYIMYLCTYIGSTISIKTRI